MGRRGVTPFFAHRYLRSDMKKRHQRRGMTTRQIADVLIAQYRSHTNPGQYLNWLRSIATNRGKYPGVQGYKQAVKEIEKSQELMTRLFNAGAPRRFLTLEMTA